MKTRVISIIVLIAIVLLTVAMVKGMKIGNLQILSISQLKERNATLSEKIEQASALTSIDYPENEEKLERTFNDYLVQKQKYEQLSRITNDEDKEIYETKQYDISYLWEVLGKYATNRGLTLGIDVQKNNTGNSVYDFNFTLTGSYVNISQFITDIENDSDLYFRIYNFAIIGKEVEEEGKKYMITTATFTVKRIGIDPSTIKQ